MCDCDYIVCCQLENVWMWVWLVEVLVEKGVFLDMFCVNFILVCFVDEMIVKVCDEVLKVQGLIVWLVVGYGLLQCLCIIVGDEVFCCCVVYVIGQFMVECVGVFV